jgi:hypothetical protein
MPDDDLRKEPQPQTQTEPAGPGGGRRVKTALGLGDSSGGSGWYKPREFGESPSPSEPIRHLQLKEIAIQALSRSKTRNFSDVYEKLTKDLSDYTFVRKELAETMAALVVSAYTVAQYVPDEYVLNEMRFSFGCFSETQLKEIIEMASRNKPVVH